jgi:hypothetical protein
MLLFFAQSVLAGECEECRDKTIRLYETERNDAQLYKKNKELIDRTLGKLNSNNTIVVMCSGFNGKYSDHTGYVFDKDELPECDKKAERFTSTSAGSVYKAKCFQCRGTGKDSSSSSSSSNSSNSNYADKYKQNVEYIDKENTLANYITPDVSVVTADVSQTAYVEVPKTIVSAPANRKQRVVFDEKTSEEKAAHEKYIAEEMQQHSNATPLPDGAVVAINNFEFEGSPEEKNEHNLAVILANANKFKEDRKQQEMKQRMSDVKYKINTVQQKAKEIKQQREKMEEIKERLRTETNEDNKKKYEKEINDYKQKQNDLKEEVKQIKTEMGNLKNDLKDSEDKDIIKEVEEIETQVLEMEEATRNDDW